MKLTKFLSGIAAFLLLLPAGAYNATAQSFTINDIPLEWKDFTVKEGFRNHPYSAKIYTQVLPWRYEFRDGKATFTLEIKVDRDKTWVKEEFMKTAGTALKQQLLNHEKGHLIIALINVRQMANALTQYQYTRNYKREIDSIAKSFYSQLTVLNETYDNETNHMLITDKQEEWATRLLQQLNELYADERKVMVKSVVNISIPN